jgi:hypothetical protein
MQWATVAWLFHVTMSAETDRLALGSDVEPWLLTG